MCNDVQREGVKLSPDLAFGLFCYVPLHNFRYGIFPSGYLKKIKIPLPSLDVQKQIVAQIEEEQKRAQATKELAEIFEQKIKDKIAEVWGEVEASEAEIKTPSQFGTFKQVKRVQEPEVEQAELGLS